VRENYYDDRGNNYLQRLIVCIGCKAFIRRIIRTAACTTVYLLLTNCHFNPLLVYNSRHHAWTYASITRPNTRINCCSNTQQFSQLLQSEYTSVHTRSCGPLETSVSLALPDSSYRRNFRICGHSATNYRLLRNSKRAT